MRRGVVKKFPGHFIKDFRKTGVHPGGFQHAFLQDIISSLQKISQKSYLTSKIIVQRRFCDPCPVYDLLNSHCIISFCIKQIQRGIQKQFSVVYKDHRLYL